LKLFFNRFQKEMATKRGSFILFEGVDRCGKTTQCTRLLEWLKKSIGNDKVEFMRFPDRTTSIGTTINSYLTNAQEMDDRAIHLLFAANRWEAAANIRQKLADGVTIVCDRYSYSGVAFTSAKPGMDLDVSFVSYLLFFVGLEYRITFVSFVIKQYQLNFGTNFFILIYCSLSFVKVV
tara:strand:+ start:107 stop:640 length:534 start_codon:yes stop_codon:yes gene_type:complete